VLDFAGVTFMDSAVIGVLIAAQRNDTGGPIRIRGVQPLQMSIFDIAGVSEYLNAESAT
jgi:anti-anti-sigma factor